MTKDELKELIVDGESDCLGFKETTGRSGEVCWTLCALLNGADGACIWRVSQGHDGGQLKCAAMSAIQHLQ